MRPLVMDAGDQRRLKAGEPLEADVQYAMEYDAGTSGAAVTIDPANGNRQRLSVDQSTTITLAAPPAGAAVTLGLRITNAAAGVAITWAASPAVRWMGGMEPDFDDASGAEHVYVWLGGDNGWVGDGDIAS